MQIRSERYGHDQSIPDLLVMKSHLLKITGASLSLLFFSASVSLAQPAVSQTTTITSAGTISDFGREMFMVRTEASPEPVRYSYSKTTTYVDEAGNPVSIETVKSGLPVTVYYTKAGDRMVATKVIVRKVVVPETPVVVEKKTTTTTTVEKK